MGNSSSSTSVPSGRNSKVREIRAIVIGETGCGKTSLLNLIGNMVNIKNLLRDEKDLTLASVKHLHHEAKTDRTLGEGCSRTNKAHPHTLHFGSVDVCLVDTPGFGDTRGFDQDKKNVESIQSVISVSKNINAIILVINGRNSRVTPQFRYVLSQVTAMLPHQILDQIIVVFTNVEDPLDLNFEVNLLKPYLGKVPPEEHVCFIDNPYAKIAKLSAKSDTLQPVALKKSLKNIMRAFDSTYEELDGMFARILKLPDMAPDAFIKVFQARKTIEESAIGLRSELGNLANQRAKLQKDTEELNSDKLSLAELRNSLVAKETWEQRSGGTYHMMCDLCRQKQFKEFQATMEVHQETLNTATRNGQLEYADQLKEWMQGQCQYASICHDTCEVPDGHGKEDRFPHCQCFQWRKKKTMRIVTQDDRELLLSNLYMARTSTVNTETGGNKTDTGLKTHCKENFTINGATCRGNPETTHIAPHLGKGAGRWSIEKDAIPSESLPFDISFEDWENLEQGPQMTCNRCEHSLTSHQYYFARPYFVMVPTVEEHASDKAKHSRAQRELDAKATANARMARALADLEARERTVRETLRKNLATFGQVAIVSSYVKLMNEQLMYLELLIKDASESGQFPVVEMLRQQMKVIKDMQDSVNEVSSPRPQ